MARPIEATPPVIGEDAERLLAQLDCVPPPEELTRRIEAAKRFLAAVTTPKTSRAPVSTDR